MRPRPPGLAFECGVRQRAQEGTKVTSGSSGVESDVEECFQWDTEGPVWGGGI